MQRHKHQYGSIGSISTGTLRTQDLLPAFLDECESLRLSRDERNAVRQIRKTTNRIINGRYGDEDAYWQEIASLHVDKLQDILNNHALPYFYFGSHPGDGADFGFWLSDCLAQDFDGLRVSDLSEIPHDFAGEVLHVNDHGNMTLYSAFHGRLREVWSIV